MRYSTVRIYAETARLLRLYRQRSGRVATVTVAEAVRQYLQRETPEVLVEPARPRRKKSA